MPRVKSIRSRLAAVLGTSLQRVEDELIKDKSRVLTKQEAETLLLMAKADSLLQGRKAEDDEDGELTGSADPRDAKAIVERLKAGATAAQGADGDEDDEKQ